MTHKNSPHIFVEWQAPDHDLTPKGLDWYVSVIVLGAAITIASFIADNFLLAILAILATTAIILHASKRPEMIKMALTVQGIQIKDVVYPYTTLHSFWIRHEESGVNQMTIISEKMLMPVIFVPLGDIDPDIVRGILREYVPEIYHRKMWVEKVFEYFGL